MGLWVADDVEVYNAAAVSASWTDLDLSAHVGANVSFVLLGVQLDNFNRRLAFRPDGSAANYLHIDSSHHGMSYKHIIDSSKWSLFGCLTSAAGMIEHRCDSTDNLTVRLLGHCVLSDPGPSLLASPFTFTADGVYETYDLSGQQGSAQGLAFLEYLGQAFYGGVVALRSPGDTRGSEYLSGVQGGSNRGSVYASGPDGTLFAVATDSSGYYEHAGTGSASGTTRADLTWYGSETSFYVPVDTVIQDTVLAEDDWNEIDVSAYVSCRSLCLVKVENGATGSQNVSLYPRKHGESRDFGGSSGASHGLCHTTDSATGRTGDLLVECDGNGILDLFSYYSVAPNTSIKVTLVGYIPSVAVPPVLVPKSPQGVTTEDQPPIRCEITDSYGMDTSTLSMVARPSVGAPLTAISAGSFTTGWTGNIHEINGAKRVVIDITDYPDLEKGVLWTFEVTASSVSGEVL